jgi:type I restriction enzyme R subunit
MQGVFGADAAEVYEEDGGRNHAKNARVHVATYQTLGIDREDGDPSFLFRHYPENYFSHIVIDECHRSAWGKWSVVLTRNPNAVQIGLTATPRQIKCDENTNEAKADAEVTADNLKYFGEPVYEYGLA